MVNNGQITCAPRPEENMNALPILDTWQKKCWLVDIPIDTKRLVRISLYPSKIDRVHVASHIVVSLQTAPQDHRDRCHPWKTTGFYDDRWYTSSRPNLFLPKGHFWRGSDVAKSHWQPSGPTGLDSWLLSTHVYPTFDQGKVLQQISYSHQQFLGSTLVITDFGRLYTWSKLASEGIETLIAASVRQLPI